MLRVQRTTTYLRRYALTMLTLFFTMVMLLGACKEDDPATEPEPEPEVPTPTDTVTVLDPLNVDTTGFYIPKEFRKMDFYKSTSTWYHGRSRASQHFIVFWGSGYKNLDPASPKVPEAYRVDIDDLLEKAEEFYALNINELKFAEVGVGKSKLDKHKMLIFIYYQAEWLATGSGYDDNIGALWINPSTCKPVGSTIAHEIGHSFQYQVSCDLGLTHGFRYGFGGNGGNGFWEQTAQWQSYQSYPVEAFTSYNFTVYSDNHFRHVGHELYRYASYFIHYYWADKHGKDIIGKIWRQSERPEDPVEAYMRITGINVEQLNAEIYDAATKFVTWDLDALRQNGANYIGRQSFKSTKLDDGSYQVTYDRCPGTTGYNVIPLNLPAAGTVVSAAFTGMVNASGFNTVADPGRAGWRYGYVALKKDGSRVYSDMYAGTTNTATFTVPDNCDKLWFVVTGAPNTYKPHAWDENESNDDQWPYKVKFTNTQLYGDVVFDGTEVPADVTLTFNVKFPFSATVYPGASVQLDGENLMKLAKAFVLQPNEISEAIDEEITFFGVESNGTLNPTNTAIGHGHWFDANGNIIAWGTDAMVFSEFDAINRRFSIGQYPGHCEAGDTFTIKQALVYEHTPGETVQATFVFNVTIE